jgi:uncharacterized membrane protein
VKRFPLVRVGLLVTVLPIILAFLDSVFHGGSMFDEGSGGGTYLWFLIYSIPLGVFLVFIGLILLLLRRRKS